MSEDRRTNLVQHKLPLAFDPVRLRDDLAGLTDLEPHVQPGPYHDGEWTGISLRSAGGRPGAAPCFPSLEEYAFTSVVDRSPYFKEVLSSLPLHLQVVRVLSLPPGGSIKEHFDFFTNFQFGLLRLHIPIVTHPDVEFLIAGERCRWSEGELWYGDFAKTHSVRNASSVTRVHMVLDCEIDETLLSMLPPDYVSQQRRSGITVRSSTPVEPVSDLSRYGCRFRVPGNVMPILVLGNLRDLMRGCSAQVTAAGSRLVVLLDGGQEFSLRQLGENRFAIVGMTEGCFLQFDVGDDRVHGVSFVIRGVQRDLVAARVGIARGDVLPEQKVPLELLDSPRRIGLRGMSG